ncbi:MAG: PIN domain-containing protein [Janthinobacterium lividum]
MPKKSKPKVFLDANIVIAAGKPPGGPIVARVAGLVQADLITVLTTDLTITEVAKKHVENDYEVIKEVGRAHFRKIVEEVVGTKLPDITKGEIKTKLTSVYDASTTAMFKTLGATTLGIDNVKPSTVFAAYAASEGFFTGESKKDQFPDAFIFECLRAEATKKQPVIIVSNDGDYDKPVHSEQHISLVKSLPQLFKALGLEIEAPEVGDFLEEHKDELVEAANRELADWGLIADVEDAEIDETTVTEIEVKNLTAFKPSEEGGSILVVGQVTIKANVSYTHPDWEGAIYDSEDKQLIPFEDVSGETEVILTVDISMLIGVDDDGNPAEIEELIFRNSDFQYVELHPHDPHEFM